MPFPKSSNPYFLFCNLLQLLFAFLFLYLLIFDKAMTYQFGEKIKELREKQKLFLRQVAAQLDMDTAQLSKIEKGTRLLKQEQLEPLSKILKAEFTELHTLWLADQVLDLVKDQPNADEALKSVSKTIKKK